MKIFALLKRPAMGCLFLGSALQASLWDLFPFSSNNETQTIQISYEEWANSENGFLLYDCDGAYLNFASELGTGIGLILAYAYEDQFTFDRLLERLIEQGEWESDEQIAWALALAQERVFKKVWDKSLDYEAFFNKIVYRMRMDLKSENLFLPAYNVLDRGPKIGIIDPLSEKLPTHRPASSFLLTIRNNSLKSLQIDRLKGEGTLTLNDALSPVLGRPYSYSLKPMTSAKIIYTPGRLQNPRLSFELNEPKGRFIINLKDNSWKAEVSAPSSDTTLLLDENVALLSYTEPALRAVDFSFVSAKEERVGRVFSDFQNGKWPDTEFLIWAAYEGFFKSKGDATKPRVKKIVERYLDTVDLTSLEREPRLLAPYYLAATLAERPLEDSCDELFSYSLEEHPPLTKEEGENALFLLLVQAILENRLPSK